MGKLSAIRNLFVRWSVALGVAALVASMGAPARGASPAVPAVSLIYCGWFGNTIPTPSFIRSNQAFLDSQPFRGLVAYLRDDATGANATTGVMGKTALAASTLASIVAPLKGLPFTNLVDNFGLVQGSTPPDFFDDWTAPIQNFAELAAVLKDAGLRGICFDNEQYFSPWGNYPDGVKYPARSLQEYRDQARLRGAQVMQAMVARYPEIAVITLHGPYISELKAPASLQFPQWQSGNMLLGPFFAGFVEGAGTTGLSVDGGELYTLRSDSDFLNSANWRRNSLPSDAVDCPFIPPALRTVWPARVSISFGIYDRPFGGAPMDATVLKNTVTNALRRADRYVWFYTEGPSFLLPPSSGGASAAWVDAVRQGVAAAPQAPEPPAAPGNLGASALSASEISLQWAGTATGIIGYQIERKVGNDGTFSPLAQVGADVLQYTDSSLSASTTYVYRVRSTTGAATSTFSNEAGATTAAPAAPPPSDPGPDPAPPATPPPSSTPGANGGGDSAPSGGGGGSSGSCGLLGLEGFALLAGSLARRLSRAASSRKE